MLRPQSDAQAEERASGSTLALFALPMIIAIGIFVATLSIDVKSR